MQAPTVLVLDFVEWVAAKPRTYREANDVWQTSCPRLPVWEDAFDLGYIKRVHQPGSIASVEATRLGMEALRREGRHEIGVPLSSPEAER